MDGMEWDGGETIQEMENNTKIIIEQETTLPSNNTMRIKISRAFKLLVVAVGSAVSQSPLLKNVLID